MEKQTLLKFATGSSYYTMPATRFLGVNLTDADSIQIQFQKLNGEVADNLFKCTFEAGMAKEACEVLAGALSSRKKGILTIADDINGVYLHPFIAFEAIS
tara:strand:- start:640 stop:939 length:300 start_codon:yes stop_codon:yes gene_type:complete